MSAPRPCLAYLLSSIGKKALMALSGGGLSLFLLAHLIGVSHLLKGRASFLDYAARLHGLGLWLNLLELGLAALFLIHVTTGLLLFRETLTLRPTPYHLRKRGGGSTWASRTMPYSGLILLLFLVQHLGIFWSPGAETTLADLVRRSFLEPSTTLFTIFAMLALTLHLSHGLWSLCQSLGLNTPRYDPLLRGGARLLSLLGGGIYSLIPLLVLLLDDFLR